MKGGKWNNCYHTELVNIYSCLNCEHIMAVEYLDCENMVAASFRLHGRN